MSVRLPWRNTEPSYGPPGPSQEYPDPSTSHAPLSSSMGHPNRHLGEALCGRDDLHTHAPLHTFRERSQALAWAEPCLDARTYTLTHRSQRPESVDECTRMAKPVWRADLVPRHQALGGILACRIQRSFGPNRRRPPGPHNELRGRPTTRVPLHTPRQRSRTHAWAKPCLAGRPTALVRTQCCEQNTSRGRPSGMELPDYPVMATLPTPMDQDGPAPPLPAGSFPRFVDSFCCLSVE
jgi:hypothetical protein